MPRLTSSSSISYLIFRAGLDNLSLDTISHVMEHHFTSIIWANKWQWLNSSLIQIYISLIRSSPTHISLINDNDISLQKEKFYMMTDQRCLVYSPRAPLSHARVSKLCFRRLHHNFVSFLWKSKLTWPVFSDFSISTFFLCLDSSKALVFFFFVG